MFCVGGFGSANSKNLAHSAVCVLTIWRRNENTNSIMNRGCFIDFIAFCVFWKDLEGLGTVIFILFCLIWQALEAEYEHKLN